MPNRVATRCSNQFSLATGQETSDVTVPISQCSQASCSELDLDEYNLYDNKMIKTWKLWRKQLKQLKPGPRRDAVQNRKNRKELCGSVNET